MQYPKLSKFKINFERHLKPRALGLSQFLGDKGIKPNIRAGYPCCGVLAALKCLVLAIIRYSILNQV